MEETNAKKPTSSFDLFKKSKDLVIANINTYAVVLFLPFLSALFSLGRSSKSDNLISSSANPAFDISPLTFGLGAGFAIIILIGYVIASIATYSLNLEVSKGKKPTVKELWEFVQKYGVRLLGLGIVTGFIVLFGLLALIIPGLIFIRRYYLAPYVMIDKDLSIQDSLKESARLSKPFSGYIWSIFGVTILLSIPGMIPVVGGLVSFALTSLYSAAAALRYLELKKLVPAVKK